MSQNVNYSIIKILSNNNINFIPVVEVSGYMDSITQWMTRSSFREIDTGCESLRRRQQ